MDIYLLYSPGETPLHYKRNLLTGSLTYIARESSLLKAKNPDIKVCDLIVVTSNGADSTVTPAIYDEARKMSCRKVFLDFQSATSSFSEICASLLQRGLIVFSPFWQEAENGLVPVVEGAVSGGFLSELFQKVHSSSPNFAVSLNPSFCEISLPASKDNCHFLSRQEVSLRISRYCPDIYFSPQMQCKYFVYNPDGDSVRLVLFDDAETISSKIRLAKKHGASHAFFVYSEIRDIVSEIVF